MFGNDVQLNNTLELYSKIQGKRGQANYRFLKCKFTACLKMQSSFYEIDGYRQDTDEYLFEETTEIKKATELLEKYHSKIFD